MGKGSIFVVASFVAACLASCAVGRSSVAGPGLLDGYDYAVLKMPESGYGGRADLACVQSEIFSALDATRLDMVGDMSVGDLTGAEKRRLLVVRFTVSLDDEVAVVSATLADYAQLLRGAARWRRVPRCGKGCKGDQETFWRGRVTLRPARWWQRVGRKGRFALHGRAALRKTKEATPAESARLSAGVASSLGRLAACRQKVTVRLPSGCSAMVTRVASPGSSSSEVLLGGGECRAAAKAAKEIRKLFGVGE